MEERLYYELVYLAQEKYVSTYSDIGNSLGLSMADEKEREQLADLLTVIARSEDNKNHPMLTALVIRSGANEIASDGFFELAYEFGLYSGSANEVDRKKFWESQIEAVYDYWDSDS